jgi:hypothetical protein
MTETLPSAGIFVNLGAEFQYQYVISHTPKTKTKTDLTTTLDSEFQRAIGQDVRNDLLKEKISRELNEDSKTNAASELPLFLWFSITPNRTTLNFPSKAVKSSLNS